MVENRNYGRLPLLLASILLAFTSLLLVAQGLAAEGAAPNTLEGSTKEVNEATAEPGETLDYTVVISNSGTTINGVQMVDALPVGLMLVGPVTSTGMNSLNGTVVTDSNTITWTGDVGENGSIEIAFSATLDSGLLSGDMVTNTAVISSGLGVISPTATTTVMTMTASPTSTIFLPMMFKSPPMVTGIFASRPIAANDWTIFWGATTGVESFEIQESQSPTFNSILNTYTAGASATSYLVNTHPPSPNNSYFYRARAIAGGTASEWSDTIEVVGAYFDDFTSDDTGWAIRRTTFLEEVRSFYEISGDKSWLIMQSENSWDWGIAAPYRKAPTPPYVIEYRSKVANRGNLVSQGMVFGADWDDENCPDYSTLEGVYEHDLCFNQFYNLNTIWFGPLKMLFERVDRLVWCPSDPNCQIGGSPMKRGGDTQLRDPIPNVDSDDWNVWVVEVRDSGITISVNGQSFMTYNDTRYINNPYFGVFASTDEYSNSTGRFDYVRITPIGN